MASGVTTFDEAMAVHYDELFMEWEKEQLMMSQFAQKRPLPGNRGEVVHFKGHRPFELVTSPLTQGTAPTTHGTFEYRDITTQVSEWGSTAKMSKLLSLVKLDKGLEAQIELVGDQAGRSIDYAITREVVRNGLWGIAGSQLASDQITVTVRSSASNSTSVFCADAHNSNDIVNAWVGAVITPIKDGAAWPTRSTKYGWAGRGLTWTSESVCGDVFTVNTTAPHAAAPEAFQSGDTVRICSHRRATAGLYPLTTSHIRRAQRDLKNARALRFGRYYAALLNPDTFMDFASDTTWVNADSYSNITELWEGEIGRWFGFRFSETTLPGREDTDGTENVDTGAIYHNLFFGRNAFGHTELEGGANNKKIYVVTGEDKTDPLDQYTIVGWKQYFANKALNARWCVSVMGTAAA